MIGQTYDNVEYIIIDGGSRDGTLDIIRKYEHAVDYWVSERDEGMYDALSKAFLLTTGELIQYINAGDFLYQNSLHAIRKIFTQHSEIKWITGYRTLCNQENIIIRIELPVRYKNKLIQQGIYGRFLPYIQQESTVWKKELLQKINIGDLKKFKLAGDYYLWDSFSYHAKLYIVKTPIGVFKKHPEQLSNNIREYFREVQCFSKKRNILTCIYVLIELMIWCFNIRIVEKIISYKEISCEENII
ncbi:MAG: glycosyltransferase [Candidatus Electrothrix sp. MAN1_4]|nr:glycosyltransferase [Candidatus Electrothrix sp. MAN1_4]